MKATLQVFERNMSVAPLCNLDLAIEHELHLHPVDATPCQAKAEPSVLDRNGTVARRLRRCALLKLHLMSKEICSIFSLCSVSLVLHKSTRDVPGGGVGPDII